MLPIQSFQRAASASQNPSAGPARASRSAGGSPDAVPTLDEHVHNFLQGGVLLGDLESRSEYIANQTWAAVATANYAHNKQFGTQLPQHEAARIKDQTRGSAAAMWEKVAKGQAEEQYRCLYPRHLPTTGARHRANALVAQLSQDQPERYAAPARPMQSASPARATRPAAPPAAVLPELPGVYRRTDRRSCASDGWRACWTDHQKNKKEKGYSVGKWGEDGARQKAREQIQKVIDCKLGTPKGSSSA